MVIVDWPEAVASGDPPAHIRGLVVQKLQLQEGYEEAEIDAVKVDPVLAESAAEIAGRLHRKEEKRVVSAWHDEKVDDKVHEKVAARYTRPGTRGWMNRQRDPLRSE